jgi:hypothetical protein
MPRKTRKDANESEKPKAQRRSTKARSVKELKAEDIKPKETIEIKEEAMKVPEKMPKKTPERGGAIEAAVQGPVIGTPSMIWSTYGSRGNFEVVAPLANGGAARYWRDNDNEDLPWNGPEVFGQERESGIICAVSLVQSDFGEQGNLELAAVDIGGHKLMHFWRDSGPGYDWHGPIKISRDALVPLFSGNPAMVWSKSGQRGNFDVVVPRAEGGFSYYWRDNDDTNLDWHGPIDFATGAGVFNALTMIQSNFEDHLEMAARSGDELFFFWRGSDLEWHGPERIATGIIGTPSMIQSSNEGKGNFELVTPLRSGGLGYFWRDNDDPHLHWYGPFMFAMNMGRVDAVSLIQSDFGENGNLELIAQADNQLAFFWRDSGMDRRWNGPEYLPRRL